MTKVTLFREGNDAETMTFRAVAGHAQTMGRTAGEAVDALTAQLPEEEAVTLILVRDLRPDESFGATSRQRLEALMARWRAARDAGSALSTDEQAELERLVDDEVRAAAQRAAALRQELAS